MAKRSAQKKRKSVRKSKTEQRSGKPVFVLLILLIPVLIYMLSFSSIIHNKPFIEGEMEKAGLFFSSKEINSYVMQYIAEPVDKDLIRVYVFTEAEQEHLLDVKILVHRAFDVLFLLIVLFCILAYLSRKRDWGKILTYGGGLASAIPIILYLIPFDILFTGFHKIFFECGTWQFPITSALVQIYPAAFWQSVSFALFFRGFIAGIILAALGIYIDRCCLES